MTPEWTFVDMLIHALAGFLGLKALRLQFADIGAALLDMAWSASQPYR